MAPSKCPICGGSEFEQQHDRTLQDSMGAGMLFEVYVCKGTCIESSTRVFVRKPEVVTPHAYYAGTVEQR